MPLSQPAGATASFSCSNDLLNKVPQLTVLFWIIKIMATTVGETAADFLAVRAGLGAGLTMALMVTILIAVLFLQLRSSRHVPWIYWLTVVLVSIVGTQITDLLTDDLDVSLYASTALFATVLAVIFATWHRVEGTLSVHTIVTTRRELFYWSAILCTFALGTAAGDLATEAIPLGFGLGVIVFGTLIAAVTAVYYVLGRGPILAFWSAYVLTRPLGASLGDLLSQQQQQGGLGLGTLLTSLTFFAVIAAGVVYLTVGPNGSRSHHESIERT